MIALMHDAQGVGLAATQVGVLRRVFVFEPDEEGRARSSTRARRARRRDGDRRGGLPVAAGRPRAGRARDARHARGQGPDGDDVRFELEGMRARVVQHELDHLDGVLIIDRTDDEHRKEALGKLRPQPVLR